MTKNSLCSCPQTCKLITSWVNSVKAADFQGMHVTLASAPSGCTANRWEGPCSLPGQHLMSLQFLWLSPTLGFSSAFLTCHLVFQQPFHGSVATHERRLGLCCGEVLHDGDPTPPLNPLFLVQNPRNCPQQAHYSGHQLPWHAGFHFSLYTSTHGWCEENHPRRCVRTRSIVWLLAFTEPLLSPHSTKAEKVTSVSYFFRVDYIGVQCQILGSASKAKCILKRRGLPSAFFEAVTHEHTYETISSSCSPLCSQLRATQVADKTGYELTPPRAQVEKGFFTAQGDADSPQKLHKVRNSLE